MASWLRMSEGRSCAIDLRFLGSHVSAVAAGVGLRWSQARGCFLATQVISTARQCQRPRTPGAWVSEGASKARVVGFVPFNRD